jgi:AraC-like DNA-binding protein
MIASQPRTHAQIGTHPAPFAETITMMSNTRQHQDADLLLPEEIAETASLLSRLAHRSKMEPVMCRAARHLQSNPALSVRRLASQLGVREDYLARGLRTILGTNPNRLTSIAHNAKARRKIVNEMTQPKYILGHSKRAAKSNAQPKSAHGRKFDGLFKPGTLSRKGKRGSKTN